MRILIAPDKFKGSLPAAQVAAAVAAGIQAGLGPRAAEAELVTIPVADAARERWTRPSRPASSACP